MSELSENLLSGMPGDKVKVETSEGFEWKEILSCGWQPAPKGGKVWSYTLIDSSVVSALSVSAIMKAKQTTKDNFDAKEAELDAKINMIKLIIASTEIHKDIKLGIYLLLERSKESLEIAKEVIDDILNELSTNGHLTVADATRSDNNGEQPTKPG